MDYKLGLLIYYSLTINRNDLVLSRDPIHHVIWLLLTSLISFEPFCTVYIKTGIINWNFGAIH